MKDTTLEGRAKTKNGVTRLVFSVVCILLEVIFVLLLFTGLNRYAEAINLCTRILGLIVILNMYASPVTSTIKMPWIFLIMVFPIMGLTLYLMVGLNGGTNKMRKRYKDIDEQLLPLLPKNHKIQEKLQHTIPKAGNISSYIQRNALYPVYQNTDVTYYNEALKGLEAQLEELAKAEHFIFMEYHAIEDAQSFAGMKSILFEKAKEGVEVRLIYDDVGSMGFINTDFVKQMESQGIQCRIFNKIVPFVNMFMNNRDHRKITVIDGQVGFTGGYNLADEYFNITHPYGLWKDTGVRMEGDAVRSLTVMFLEMWNAIKKTDTDYTAYFPEITYTAKQTGYVQPYADNPLDDEHTGENVYMNVLNSAREYAYFITPYLLISDEMKKAFTLAARRGVDVRIITPGIPDKKFVYQATRSYYNRLVKKGVRIFEYTPGFCHAKQCVSDDKAAVVGTINLDYRSLYHHFENAAAFYHKDAVAGVKADFDHLFEECHEVTEQYRSHRSTALRIGQCILRLFAPLL